ncbi:SAF domain-containing protein [Microbacterium sp. Leaf320]|uniref:SAF domain-containing protein n=1 Tax=Microbacterium sp. Leaf320 TaxID=1736334 RepID=UPI0006FE3248|nr:hypothetical protein [Microbacterium sp. Leaf320]KQQ68838.1 hypothetical protein ASF63_02300 [Microbacterium sp. Leaf320]
MHKFARTRRAVWGDARFLIGIALVVLSIGGVWAVVSSAGSTTPVLQANRTIVRGEALVSGDFQIVEVGLGAITDRYLAPQDLHPGQVASRTVAAGELMSETAAEDADASRTTTIVVDSSTGVPADVATGSVVELWHAPPPAGDENNAQATPRILVSEAIVASVTRTDGMLATDATMVEVVVDRAEVADVLGAITGGSVLSVVPIGTRS